MSQTKHRAKRVAQEQVHSYVVKNNNIPTLISLTAANKVDIVRSSSYDDKIPSWHVAKINW